MVACEQVPDWVVERKIKTTGGAGRERSGEGKMATTLGSLCSPGACSQARIMETDQKQRFFKERYC